MKLELFMALSLKQCGWDVVTSHHRGFGQTLDWKLDRKHKANGWANNPTPNKLLLVLPWMMNSPTGVDQVSTIFIDSARNNSDTILLPLTEGAFNVVSQSLVCLKRHCTSWDGLNVRSS